MLIQPTANRCRTGGDRLTPRRRVGLVLLVVAALAGATACGNDTTTLEGTGQSTTTPTTTSTTTTTPTTSAVPSTAIVTTVARPTAPIEELVGSEGGRVHVRCVGEGDTTALLISGFGGDTTSWDAVEPALATRTRVCSYDRPGTGTSDPATSTATFRTHATDLHSLLNTIGEPGPYVVVGHSFGGAQAVTFASLFADEVAGLVLIDASPTIWPAALCAVPNDGSEAAAVLGRICTDSFPPSGNSEQLDVIAAFAEAAQIVSLGSVPMAVITATRREVPSDLSASEVDRLTETWDQGQRDWLAMSPEAHLVSVDDTGHHIQIDQPAVVIDEIIRLIP